MERPLERRAAARTAVVWEALQTVLATGADGPPLVVVDVGGGTGGFAVRIAELGHRVTVVDPSPDALAAAERRADESGLTDGASGTLTAIQGDLTDLVDLVSPGAADLVLCHGVLGLLDDPVEGLRSIATVLRPGGTLSLLVGQRNAAVLARAMAGHFQQARDLLHGVAPGEHRFTVEECQGLLEAVGLEVRLTHGVRVFADLVPSAVIEAEPGALDALVDLEREAAVVPDLMALAAGLHLLAVR